MDRVTRDKFTSRTNRSMVSGNSCLETPPAVFTKLNAEFGPFDLDLFADSKRHLCDIWLGPGSPICVYDALSAEWADYGRDAFANPVYGATVGVAYAKAKYESQTHGVRSTWLTPLRASNAFQRHVIDGAAMLLFCDKRINFWRDGAPRRYMEKSTGELKLASALFDSIIVRYIPGHVGAPQVGIWEVPKHV